MVKPIRSKSFVATHMTPVKVISGQGSRKTWINNLGEE